MCFFIFLQLVWGRGSDKQISLSFVRLAEVGCIFFFALDDKNGIKNGIKKNLSGGAGGNKKKIYIYIVFFPFFVELVPLA